VRRLFRIIEVVLPLLPPLRPRREAPPADEDVLNDAAVVLVAPAMLTRCAAVE